MIDRYYPLRAGDRMSRPSVDPHAPGAKLDAGKVKMRLVLQDMPRALLAVGDVATYGARKYSAGGWQSVPDGIERYTDALFRHAIAEGIRERDAESGLLHAAHVAWNALARLELMLRAADAHDATRDEIARTAESLAR